MKRRILLIEDDRELGAQIVRRLGEAGYEVTWWQEGVRLTPSEIPKTDLVILDLMLPSVYGMEILKDIRAASEVPALILSARDGTQDKVRALKLGADDYLTKPFWPEELLARVAARLRRPSLRQASGDIVCVGDLRMDKGARTVSVAEEPVELTRMEYELLLLLVERAGAAVLRRHLVDLGGRAVDAERPLSERTLDVHLSRLRKKLGPRVQIDTVWGIGYRLAKEEGP